MLRVEMTDYNKKHMPQYGILEIELDKSDCVVYDYKFHQFRIAKPSSAVFDFNSMLSSSNEASAPSLPSSLNVNVS